MKNSEENSRVRISPMCLKHGLVQCLVGLLWLGLCSNTSFAAGHITLIAPADRAVEYGNSWAFGTPTATTTCAAGSAVTIRVLGTVTNYTGCGETFTAIRSWSATDPCGNSNTCSQIVAVQDTQPPDVNYLAAKQVELGAPWTFDEPLATDECIFYSLVYDDSVNDLVTRFDAGTSEIGDEIILAGTARYLSSFTLEYWGTSANAVAFEGNVSARVRFYQNNGPAFNGYATPGTVLFDSGPFAVQPTSRSTLTFVDFATGAAVPLTGPLPDSFTWSIQFSGLTGSDQAGIDLFSPPVIGETYPDYWDSTGGTWQLKQGGVAMDFAAVAYASHSTGGVSVVILNTSTNFVGCGGSYSASRTWEASDPCGNSTNFTQTVNVLDTTPPALTCAAPKTVAAGSPWTFDPPMANDQAIFDTLSLLIYDDSVHDLVTRFDPGTLEVGDEITLGGTARYLSSFTLEYWAIGGNGSTFKGNVTGRLRFYANDGTEFHGYRRPGTLLYDSGSFSVAPTSRSTLTFNDFVSGATLALAGPLPNSFTWSIQFSGLGGGDQAGVDLFSPPVVGDSYPDYWEFGGGGWQLRESTDSVAMNFAALAYASQLAVSIVNTVTNYAGCPASYTATRTWQATDPCGNRSLCSQTVTVQEVPDSTRLQVQRQDQSIVISWPVSGCGYTLQGTDNLTTPNWSAASGQVRIANNRVYFTTSATGSARYFRLTR